MKHILLLLICSVTLVAVSFSQVITSQTFSSLDKLQYDVFKNNRLLSDEQVEAAQGSPYLDQHWYDAEVILYGSDKVFTAKMRYNNFSDEMELNDKEVIKTFSDKKAIRKIMLGGDVFRIYPYKEDNQIKQGFYVEMDSSEIGLYTRTPIIYKPEKKSETGYDQAEPAKFIVRPTEYYIRSGNNPPVFVPDNKKKATQVLNDYGIDLTAYLKEHKLKITNAGLADLVIYLNK